jgi:hypothetical protein
VQQLSEEERLKLEYEKMVGKFYAGEFGHLEQSEPVPLPVETQEPVKEVQAPELAPP